MARRFRHAQVETVAAKLPWGDQTVSFKSYCRSAFVALASLTIIVAAGCTGSRASETPAPANTQTPSPTATAIVAPTSAPTEATTATAARAFFLEVTAPGDEEVLRTSPVEVQGRTMPDAVVSVNGEAVEVDADGQFLRSVALEEGPNTIEVIASDFQGNQESVVLTVIFVQ
jgi:uncharacterized protein YfaP (DUF2135 family)